MQSIDCSLPVVGCFHLLPTSYSIQNIVIGAAPTHDTLFTVDAKEFDATEKHAACREL